MTQRYIVTKGLFSICTVRSETAWQITSVPIDGAIQSFAHHPDSVFGPFESIDDARSFAETARRMARFLEIQKDNLQRGHEVELLKLAATFTLQPPVLPAVVVAKCKHGNTSAPVSVDYAQCADCGSIIPITCEHVTSEPVGALYNKCADCGALLPRQ